VGYFENGLIYVFSGGLEVGIGLAFKVYAEYCAATKGSYCWFGGFAK
jgi:hypothetical protein